MGKASLLPFLQPSNAVRTSCCPISSDDVFMFISSLSIGLKKLEQSLLEGSVSLRWSVEAMRLLKKTQTELLNLLKKSKLPISYGDKEDWFDQYMQETTALLDLCNSLKSAISGINRYCMLVDLASHKLGVEPPNSSTACKEELEIERLEKELKKVFNASVIRETFRLDGVRIESKCRHEKYIDCVMLAARSVMIVVSLLVVSAIVSPAPTEGGGVEEFTWKIPKLKPFAVLLAALVERFQEKASCDASGMVLAEHKVLHSAVGDLKAQVVHGMVEDRERFLGGVELLRTKSDELREGIEMFDAVVDEVFDVVIKGRNEMLGLLRDGAPLTGLQNFS